MSCWYHVPILQTIIQALNRVVYIKWLNIIEQVSEKLVGFTQIYMVSKKEKKKKKGNIFLYQVKLNASNSLSYENFCTKNPCISICIHFKK